MHKILNDGFVRLVDSMGNDSSIVQAARVSYGEGTKTPSDDRTLIRYLMRHRHSTPFEMVEFKFHIRVPMDCWRQWIRHRTANVNEYSTRYSEAIDSMQKTEKWRAQSKTNKQGSGTTEIEWPEDYSSSGDPQDYLSQQEEALHKLSREIYEERLKFGVAREQARKDLPLSNYTEAYWKIDLHNLFHFLALRLDSHAQLEIRLYAQAMFDLINPICPFACEAFSDYRLNALTFSKYELEILRTMLKETEVPDDCGLLRGELDEFKSKLRRLNET